MTIDRDSRRQELYRLLGELPDRDRPISSSVVFRSDCENFLLETLRLEFNGIEPVPAYFLKPHRGHAPFPCVLYHHAHGGDYSIGKNELLKGRDFLAAPPYALELTSKGYAVLCIDMWGFGERRGRTESELFKEMLWKGQVLWGMMVYDALRAVDYLTWRDDVDPYRIATLGMSMGSTMSWWLAAIDTRIAVCIDLCCMTDFQSLIESRGLDGHGIYYYVPRLVKCFTTAEINALIAPRPHLALAGNYDPLTPQAGLGRIDHCLRDVYEKAKASDAWELHRYETGHLETAEMRKHVLAFLDKWMPVDSP
jgi:pimeloyl-ACP methyl ester carboxylesterase